jgi:hypothetical protein
VSGLTVSLHPLDRAGLAWAQATVTRWHYLRTPVDGRCALEGYAVHLADWGRVGLLLVGRPEAQRCYPWYGSVDDVAAGRATCSRWEVLNLARVWLDPRFQRGGAYVHAAPGYTDRRGAWRSTLASTALGLLAAQVGLDYLLRRPPCFLAEPYQLRFLLSYCDPTATHHTPRGWQTHHGTIYQASGFECYRTNRAGLQTWRLPLPPLTAVQDAAVRAGAEVCGRSRQYRARRLAAATVQQLSLEMTA